MTLLLVVERRSRRSFVEGCPVLVIHPELKRVIFDHPKHQSIAEHAGLAEHAPHRDVAERCKLFA